MEQRFLRNFKVMPNLVFSELPQTYFLSEEQKQFYNNNGYLVIKELIDFASLYSFKRRFIEICKKADENSSHILVVKETHLAKKGEKGENVVNKLQEIAYDDVFEQYVANPRLLHVVSQFICPDAALPIDQQKYGENITAMHSMFINKPPGTTRHPPHQDLLYFPFRPAELVVAAWTAIDPVTLANGCLYVVPGSHKAGVLYPHVGATDSNKFYHGIGDEQSRAPENLRVPLEMAPGDTVFFHSLLVHGSGPNLTKTYRKAISCHYANSACHYIELDGSVQQIVKDQFEGAFDKLGYKVGYNESWRYKAKQVKGVKCNL